MALTVYAYAGCGTCKKALAWLKSRGIEHEVVPIRERPPSKAQIRAVLKGTGLPLRKLFNTSGQDYRALNLKDRIDAMSEDEALTLLAGNGNLIKRPFVTGPGAALVGFDEAEWAAALGNKGGR